MCGNVSLLPEEGVENLEHGVLRRNLDKMDDKVELLLLVIVEYKASKLLMMLIGSHASRSSATFCFAFLAQYPSQRNPEEEN